MALDKSVKDIISHLTHKCSSLYSEVNTLCPLFRVSSTAILDILIYKRG